MSAGSKRRQEYDFDGLKELYLQVITHAIRDVEGGPYEQAQASAYWLMTTGWLVMRAFEIPTSRARVTRWTIEMLNVREVIADLAGGRRDP